MSYISSFNNSEFPNNGGSGGDVVTLSTNQTITGIKTFSNPILSPTTATTADELINLSQLNNLATLSGSNTFTGSNTFDISPIVPNILTNNNNLVNLTYLQNNFIPSGTDATVNGLLTFDPLPQSAVLPTNINDFVNKEYADSIIGNTLNNNSPATAFVDSGTSYTVYNQTPTYGTYSLVAVIKVISQTSVLNSMSISILKDAVTICKTGFEFSSGSGGTSFTFPLTGYFQTNGTSVITVVTNAVTVDGSQYEILGDIFTNSSVQLIKISNYNP
jgi:hypothetical protein